MNAQKAYEETMKLHSAEETLAHILKEMRRYQHKKLFKEYGRFFVLNDVADHVIKVLKQFDYDCKYDGSTLIVTMSEVKISNIELKNALLHVKDAIKQREFNVIVPFMNKQTIKKLTDMGYNVEKFTFHNLKSDLTTYEHNISWKK